MVRVQYIRAGVLVQVKCKWEEGECADFVITVATRKSNSRSTWSNCHGDRFLLTALSSSITNKLSHHAKVVNVNVVDMFIQQSLKKLG